jgi:hypothetical protein
MLCNFLTPVVTLVDKDRFDTDLKIEKCQYNCKDKDDYKKHLYLVHRVGEKQ